MDVATHTLVPYAAALAAFGFWRRDRDDRRLAALAAAFGVGGVAPDLDGLLDPLSSRVDALFWLQHRGVSHTLVGAPLFGLFLVAALALLARAFPRRTGLFAWRPGFAAAAVLGSWTHLLLDSVTLSGVPLLWPFAYGRVGAYVFSWIVVWLFPAGVVLLGLHMAGRFRRADVARAGALFVAVLVVLGAYRVAVRPDVDGALVFPRDAPSEWVVAWPQEGGAWLVALVEDGVARERERYEAFVPPEAEPAVERARATGAYKGFLMGSYGPVVVQASREGAAWNVTFVDVAQRYEAKHLPRWAPVEPFDAWGYVEFRVEGDDVRVVHKGW